MKLILSLLFILHAGSLDSQASSANLIPSVNSLITELPRITDPLEFCLCLKLLYSHCQLLHKDHPGSTRKEVREIAAVWYSRSHEPSWDVLVDALFCHEQFRDAKQLAEKKGVNWKSMLDKYQENS